MSSPRTWSTTWPWLQWKVHLRKQVWFLSVWQQRIRIQQFLSSSSPWECVWFTIDLHGWRARNNSGRRKMRVSPNWMHSSLNGCASTFRFWDVLFTGEIFWKDLLGRNHSSLRDSLLRKMVGSVFFSGLCSDRPRWDSKISWSCWSLGLEGCVDRRRWLRLRRDVNELT